MKNSKIAAISLLIAAIMPIAGCGGSSPDAPAPMATIGGTVAGLPSGITLLLVNNGSDTISVDANGNFIFDKKIPVNSTYNVTLFTMPSYAGCRIANGTGTVNSKADSVNNISVACEEVPAGFLYYNIGVTVSGLASGNSVTFLNNGGDPLIVSGNGLFVFPKSYALEVASEGGVYSVTVAANPAGQTCTLVNASGNLGAPNYRNFANVTASCH